MENKPDNLNSEQKVRLAPEIWQKICEQMRLEKRSKAMMIKLLIERGFEHELTQIFNYKKKVEVSTGKSFAELMEGKK